jgi:hypothetical protein
MVGHWLVADGDLRGLLAVAGIMRSASFTTLAPALFVINMEASFGYRVLVSR